MARESFLVTNTSQLGKYLRLSKAYPQSLGLNLRLCSKWTIQQSKLEQISVGPLVEEDPPMSCTPSQKTVVSCGRLILLLPCLKPTLMRCLIDLSGTTINVHLRLQI